MNDTADHERQLHALQTMYPDWEIGVSFNGDGIPEWTAVRHAPISQAQRDAGLVERLTKASAGALILGLSQQHLIVHQGRARG